MIVVRKNLLPKGETIKNFCMKWILTLAFLLFITNAMSQFSNYRQVLVFRHDASLPLAKQQLTLFEKSLEGVKERDIKITIAEEGSPLFKKYKVDAQPFTLVLIGKDGYEKYRTNKLLQPADLFSIIDAMPMRRSEMKKRENK